MLLNDGEEYRIARARRLENGGYLDNGYPCMLFTEKELREVDFDTVTILYGGNGSGKSTLLNVIALKLELKRLSPYNSSELMRSYAEHCRYRLGYGDNGPVARIPSESRILTSDDVFEYMLAARSSNDDIREDTEDGKSDYAKLVDPRNNIRLNSMADYEDFRLQVLARRRSVTRHKFLKKQIGTEVKLNSNGETALEFFETYMENDTLYLLDEPENSLSPKLQIELKGLLEERARYCGCQFVIATHSPFLLSMRGAKIYDLDSSPVDIKKWWELENTRLYFDFFMENRSLFERSD